MDVNIVLAVHTAPDASDAATHAPDAVTATADA
jgi:hypothetical protein